MKLDNSGPRRQADTLNGTPPTPIAVRTLEEDIARFRQLLAFSNSDRANNCVPSGMPEPKRAPEREP